MSEIFNCSFIYQPYLLWGYPMTNVELVLSLDINGLILTIIFAILLIFSLSFVNSNDLVLMILFNFILNIGSKK